MKYGFIGCGNMGGAIAQALSKSTKDILLSDRSGKAKILASQLGCAAGSNEQISYECDRLFLAVKPQALEQVLAPLADTLRMKQPVIISMAAGVEIQKIERIIGAPLPIIRIMPNTPVLVGSGTILYCRNEAVTDAVLDDFLKDMAPCGLLDPIQEHLIDAASAVSGCGPAYAYMFIEALADGAVACGVPRDKALLYASNMLVGAAQMVQITGQHPGTLKDAVCSPGGSTIAGVRTLESHNFRGAVINCMIDAYRKTTELGK